MATNNLTQNYRAIKRRKLEWLGHAIKMDQRRVVKGAFTPAQHCWQHKLATSCMNVDNIILQQVV
jgi:hypothetical protein